MKYILLILAMMLAACGSKDKAPAGPAALTCQTLQGHYYDQYSPANTLDIAGDCTFTDSVCGYTASYTIPDRVSGATVISVAGTNGTPACMSSTSHMCVLESNGVQLGINCDSGAHLYLFIKQ